MAHPAPGGTRGNSQISVDAVSGRPAERASLYLDPWDHSSAQFEGEAADEGSDRPENVDTSVESDLPWRAIAPPAPAPAPALTFVDGVRRTHARLAYMGPDAYPIPGLCASIAAGSCTWEPGAAPAAARFGEIRARRLCLFGDGARIDLPAVEGVAFEPLSSPARDLPGLRAALNGAMRALETGVTRRARSCSGLVVADGRLGRLGDGEVVGYIKSHHRTYLEDPQQRRLAGSLSGGQRTPLFAIGDEVQIYSWYLGLTSDPDAPPWAHIARCEVSAAIGRERALKLADQITPLLSRAVLPAWREARAPQNLGPIAALEWQLARELGDTGLLQRAVALAVLAWREGRR